MHIIILRDGLSDSQIEETCNIELLQIDEVCKDFEKKIESDFKPTLTYIVIKRNHSVRFLVPEYYFIFM